MPDATIVKSDGSAERVAYDLTLLILSHERSEATRERILDLYGECLAATKGGRDWKHKRS